MPSLATASPLVPSSKSACVADPPMGVRSASTVIPVEAGAAPGRVSQMNRIVPVPPAHAAFGMVVKRPVGKEGVVC